MIKSPLVIARTGDVENAPENTLPAFESAIAHGADGVELDVHASADGELVVHHSHNLGMTDNGAGLVSEHSLAELRALDVGIWSAPGSPASGCRSWPRRSTCARTGSSWR